MSFETDVYAVVLAGGSGTRFWPKSRQKTPKQLCRLGGSSKTMLEVTLARLDGVIPPERRIIVTHADQLEETKKVTKGYCNIFIAEPEARNTANALALAALEIEALAKKSGTYQNDGPGPIMVSLHADHIIKDVVSMNRSVEAAVDSARSGFLTLLGVKPRYAETGYGYIERDNDEVAKGRAFKVKSFHEKPARATAETFIKSDRFFWNAGLFVFPVNVLIRELETNLPTTVTRLREFYSSSKTTPSTTTAQALQDTYRGLVKISVDHAILEQSKSVAVVPCDFGWQDVGSWDALGECFTTDECENYIDGDILTIDTSNCTLDSDGPLIATLGLRNLVVVASKGAILVCAKDRSQDVKLIVEKLKDAGRLKDL